MTGVTSEGQIGLAGRLRSFLTASSLPYLISAMLTLVAARLLPYFYRGDFTFKGQPVPIVIVFVGFPITVLLWLRYRGSRTTSRPLTYFYGVVAVAWVIHIALMVVHKDAFGYNALFFVPYLILIWLKTPPSTDAWRALIVFAWLMAAAFAYAWIGEVARFQAPFPVPPDLHPWESQNYWLPMDGFMGMEGRWPGPFSHNTRAGLAAAFVIVIAASRWTRSSTPLILIGAFSLSLIWVRASLLAVLAGLFILMIFSQRGLLAKVPRWARWATAAVLFVLAVVFMFFSGFGLTGRDSVWPGFLELWRSSPISGVGRTGIMSDANPYAIYEDALNIFVDELARFGALGLVTFMGVLVLGLAISLRAASAQFAAPAAVLATYLVASQADIHNDWIHPSFHTLIFILVVTAAGAWLAERSSRLRGSK